MSIQQIKSGVIADDAITISKMASNSISADELASSLNLSSKTLTFASNQLAFALGKDRAILAPDGQAIYKVFVYNQTWGGTTTTPLTLPGVFGASCLFSIASNITCSGFSGTGRLHVDFDVASAALISSSTRGGSVSVSTSRSGNGADVSLTVTSSITWGCGGSAPATFPVMITAIISPSTATW